jgi:hypothetical protein
MTMRAVLRPRLASLDVYASALLTALGVSHAACTDVIIEDDGGGGSGATGQGGGVTTGPTTGPTSGPGTTTSNVGSTSTGMSTDHCVDPMPVIVAGQDTGIDVCAGGQYRRRAALECPTNYPDTNPCCGGCPEGQVCSTQGEIACQCVPACTNDAQCGAGQLCLCGDPAGICVPAQCQSGADCGPGEECSSWDMTLGCLYYEFRCTTPSDTCGGDLDCETAPNNFCVVQPDGHRECGPGGCAIGRPFLVEDEVRTAPVVARADWAATAIAPCTAGMSPALRSALADAWEHTAKMEHASVAAFARFSLQLLALGAPPELVERTHRALADETKHARAAFALASAYRGNPVGPGRLAVDGALDASCDLASVVRLVVREGCVGETVAAVEAAEAEARAGDPVVRRVLGAIASDESEHAELAWRFVAWALEAFGDEARGVVAEELSLVKAELATPHVERRTPRDEALLDSGVVSSHLRASMRRAALARAVVPCLEALVLRRAA